MWLKQMLFDMNIVIKKPVVIHEDNQGAFFMAKNPENKRRSKHIDVRHHFTQEKINSGIIILEFGALNKQVANILTNSLDMLKFNSFGDMLGICFIL